MDTNCNGGEKGKGDQQKSIRIFYGCIVLVEQEGGDKKKKGISDVR